MNYLGGMQKVTRRVPLGRCFFRHASARAFVLAEEVLISKDLITPSRLLKTDQ
jgi:hypothetical protein